MQWHPLITIASPTVGTGQAIYVGKPVGNPTYSVYYTGTANITNAIIASYTTGMSVMAGLTLAALMGHCRAIWQIALRRPFGVTRRRPLTYVRGSEAGVAGKTTVKRLPSPGTLSKLIVPPSRSTMRCT